MGDTKQSRWKRAAWLIALVLVLWATSAYLVMPALWRRSTSRHPALDELPKITHTANGIPGDPLNLALIGTEAGLHNSLLDAGWRAADPLTWRTSLKIARTTVLRQSYDDAPVSHLYLWGRQEDSAFEKPVGHDPRKRHHVRFWRSERVDAEGRPLWAGAATYDERVGLSHTTGQITHHIAPDVDAERDQLMGDLQKAGGLADVLILEGYHETRTGKNGGGDPWRTNGDVKVGVLVSQ